MHRTPTLVLTAALALGLAGSGFAQSPAADTKPHAANAAKASADSDFAQKAAAGGKHEVAMAKFAAGKASHADVKAYANRLVKDHTAANTELMSVMKTKHITPGPAMKDEPEAWRSQSGAAFDRAFIDAAIADHEKDIAMFEMEANSGSDAELKAWAAKKLPALKEHLKMAQDLKSKLQSTTTR